MQVAVVACLGMEEPSGRSAETLVEKSPKKIPSRRGLNKGRGNMVIFRMLQHGENYANRMGLTNRERGLWNHLIRSHGHEVTAVRSLGRN